ncbi:MAG TPA: magnesium transporter [Fimbriimonadaceae bacterium]|nr:magnesium transporter [Fimbriimonadaceae bacterium]
MQQTNRDSLVATLRKELADGANPEAVRRHLERQTGTEAARILEELKDDEAVRLFDALPLPIAANALTEVGHDTQAFLLRKANREHIAQILDELPMDDAAEMIAHLQPEEIESILAQLPAVDAQEVRQLLAYPEGSAGRMMTEKFACIRREMTIAQTLAYLQTAPSDLETVNDLYVLTADGILIGVCSLRQIVTGDPDARIGDIMSTSLVLVNGTTPAQDVSKIISDYDFLALPVVGEANRMLGIVTVDDVIDFLTGMFEKDLMKITGSDAEELDRKTPAQIAKLRIPWILSTMFIELLAGLVIHFFDQTLAKVILLASFMPIISAISGNTGLQSAAIIIRGLSTGHVDLQHWKHAVGRQLGTTVILGSVCALTLGLIGAVWNRHWAFGVVVAIGMFMSVNIAGAVGTVIPLLSKRAGYDPALTAGPFETAFQDVVGISIFLAFATFMMPLLK